MKLNILGSAKDDLIEGYYFYEQQQRGIGHYFLESLYLDIQDLISTAGIHPIVFNHFHRKLSNKFPFAIYYQTDQQEINVYAVLDCRKKPTWIRSKLK
ncbi:hypothetical protein [Marinicella gelatinilytica]|uniref:hypothetical protein n=1 Tax=Marinicella gelatinilytica TaxID=2996017 RepID=UPI002260EBBF|nr:hypothetical protein [Marinicella gelatinilytica]MCX7545269.1 hypothetical protein [Marinicella gelatinilytica]